MIICATPLQSIISERIMEVNKTVAFDVIYLSSLNDIKNNFYYKKISKKAYKSSFYNVSSSNNFDKIYKVLALRFKVKKQFREKYETIYIASIHDKYCQSVLGNLNYNNLNTYDDGIANINYHSIFYLTSAESLKSKIFWSLLGNNKNINFIKSNSVKHYSIYKSQRNIVDNISYLNIFDINHSNALKNEKAVFFLGQPLYELDKSYNQFFLDKVLNYLKPDYYFPHPREKLYTVKNCNKIESEKIFEDYLISYIKKNPNTDIVVYSFFSTVLININSDRISINAICNDDLYMRFNNLYKTFEKLGINIVNTE